MRSLRMDISFLRPYIQAPLTNIRSNGSYIKSLRQGTDMQQTHTQSSGQDMSSMKTHMLPVSTDTLAQTF